MQLRTVLARWRGFVTTATGIAAACLLATLISISVTETAAWILFAASWSAAAEIQSILLVWFAWATASHTAFRGAHITIGVSAKPRRPFGLRRLVSWLGIGATGGFGLAATFYGARLVLQISNTLPATGLSAAAHYVPAVVCGPLLVMSSLIALASSSDPQPRVGDGENG